MEIWSNRMCWFTSHRMAGVESIKSAATAVIRAMVFIPAGGRLRLSTIYRARPSERK